MNALTYAVPTLLIGFFLWRGRRDPVYILALPLLLAFNRGVFLNLYALQVPLGGVGINQDDVLFVVLLIVFLYVRSVRFNAAREQVTLQLYLVFSITIFLLAKSFLAGFSSWTELMSIGHMISAAKSAVYIRSFFYLPLSILLWHLILKRFSRQEMIQLFGIITWVTAACSAVYLADLFGVKTYTRIWEPYSFAQVAGDVSVFRDYLTLPFWLNVGLGYSLANLVHGRRRATYLPVALLLTGCALLSFTRTFALGAIGLWAVALVWWLMRLAVGGGRRTPRGIPAEPGRASLLIGGTVVGSSVLLISRWSQLSAFWGYLAQRLTPLGQSAGADPNVAARVNLYSSAIKVIMPSDALLGTMAPTGLAVGVYFKDSFWAQSLVSFGLVGTLFVAALVLAAVVKAVALALNTDPDAGLLGLALLLALVMAVLVTTSGASLLFSVAASTFLLAAPDVRFSRNRVLGGGSRW